MGPPRAVNAAVKKAYIATGPLLKSYANVKMTQIALKVIVIMEYVDICS